jgi:sugar (pentulose or hexulose) kinase
LKSSLQKPSKSTRVALLDLEGQVVTSTSTPQEMMTPRPGWAEQDPDIWWRNALDNIHETMEQAEATSDEILAVGVCGQMHATVPLSKDGELLSHGVQLWCDKRSADLAGNTVREVYTIGGGARSDLWSQIKADIYKKPVYTFEASEGGILGSAILAGVGVGIYTDARAGAE